jgi:hypothetical protein
MEIGRLIRSPRPRERATQAAACWLRDRVEPPASPGMVRFALLAAVGLFDHLISADE